MSGERQVPFYCPYCGDQDLRPTGAESGGWQCGSCARVFELRFAGVAHGGPGQRRRGGGSVSRSQPLRPSPGRSPDPADRRAPDHGQHPGHGSVCGAGHSSVCQPGYGSVCVAGHGEAFSRLVGAKSPADRRPVLLAVAHGSRNAVAQACVRALARRVERAAWGAGVRVAFVQNARPLLAGALASATADVGADRVIIVPLLLSTGYHLTADIAGTAERAGVRVAGPLGPDARLVPALVGRLAEAGAPKGTPVVLAAAGSSDPAAAADVRHQASLLAARLRAPVMAAFASATTPTVDESVAELAARTGRRVAVATYLLAPGLFHDRLCRSGATWVSEPLGDHPAVARLVAGRLPRRCQYRPSQSRLTPSAPARPRLSETGTWRVLRR